VSMLSRVARPQLLTSSGSWRLVAERSCFGLPHQPSKFVEFLNPLGHLLRTLKQSLSGNTTITTHSYPTRKQLQNAVNRIARNRNTIQILHQ
jgi:hypothetical protein